MILLGPLTTEQMALDAEIAVHSTPMESKAWEAVSGLSFLNLTYLFSAYVSGFPSVK